MGIWEKSLKNLDLEKDKNKVLLGQMTGVKINLKDDKVSWNNEYGDTIPFDDKVIISVILQLARENFRVTRNILEADNLQKIEMEWKSE